MIIIGTLFVQLHILIYYIDIKETLHIGLVKNGVIILQSTTFSTRQFDKKLRAALLGFD